MRKNNNGRLRKKILTTAITTSLGLAATSLPGTAISDIYTWGNPTLDCGYVDHDSDINTPEIFVLTSGAPLLFTMIDPAGAALSNTSTPKGSNTFQTPTCGTLTYDTDPDANPGTQDGSGTANIAQFGFFNGTSPATAVGIAVNKIPAALAGGNNNLLLANMTFDWNGNNGIPVSLVWDAQAVLDEMNGTPSTFSLAIDGSISSATPLTGTGGIPGSDSTYTNTTWGYLSLGPVPLATQDFNTANISGTDGDGNTICVTGADSVFTNNIGGGCMNVNPSADINAPIQSDTKANPNRYDTSTATVGDLLGDGTGMGGSPMVDGPFAANNANFDFTSLTLFSFVDNTAPVITLNPYGMSGTNTVTIVVEATDSWSDPGATCTDAAPLDAYAGTITGPTGGTPDTSVIANTTLTYTCKDGSGNTSTIARLVKVVSPDAVITLNGGSPVTHECGTIYTDAKAVCTDNGTDIPINGTGTDPGTFGITSNMVNTATTGTGTVTWTCTDSDATPNSNTLDRTVNVVDTTAPTITFTGGSTNNPHNIVSSTTQNPIASYTDPGDAVSNDACDSGPIAILTATSGTVDMVVPDSGPESLPYTLSYSRSDSSSNLGTGLRVVNVARSQPVITLVGSGSVTLNVGQPYVELGMDIKDVQNLGSGNKLTKTASGTSSGLTYTIDASAVDTSTQGSYPVVYTATDSHLNIATEVIRSVDVGAFATASNFTMLDKVGKVFGGTNDIIFNWDQSLNTAESDLNFNMKISSEGPWPFFDFVWSAHHTRAFGPGTYSFDSGCTVAEVETTGCPAGSAANTGPAVTMTVGAGQVGAHILFDWSSSKNIDVVNVWNIDAVWDRHGDTDLINKLYDGEAGLAPDPLKPWKLVSTDVNGDDVNGSPMVDGPFGGFYANFNAGPGGTTTKEIYVGTASDTDIGGSGLASLNVWALLTGLTTLLGLRLCRRKRND